MRWKCICAYDGTEFCGWQSQSNRQGVQDILETRLSEIFKHFIRIHGSGRTDAGVHARAQVFHFDADWYHGSERLKRALNARLVDAIRIISVKAVDDSFHARFSAKKKCYHYYFQLHPTDPFNRRYVWQVPYSYLDVGRMHKAASLWVGTHDFRGFAGKIFPKENTVKTLQTVKILSRGNQFILVISGSGFLYHMVRMIMGACIMCGNGKIDPDFIMQRLRLHNLNIPILTAPAHGLFLEKIFY